VALAKRRAGRDGDLPGPVGLPAAHEVSPPLAWLPGSNQPTKRAGTAKSEPRRGSTVLPCRLDPPGTVWVRPATQAATVVGPSTVALRSPRDELACEGRADEAGTSSSIGHWGRDLAGCRQARACRALPRRRRSAGRPLPAVPGDCPSGPRRGTRRSAEGRRAVRRCGRPVEQLRCRPGARPGSLGPWALHSSAWPPIIRARLAARRTTAICRCATPRFRSWWACEGRPPTRAPGRPRRSRPEAGPGCRPSTCSAAPTGQRPAPGGGYDCSRRSC
jgi:hypothetical protein